MILELQVFALCKFPQTPCTLRLTSRINSSSISTFFLVSNNENVIRTNAAREYCIAAINCHKSDSFKLFNSVLDLASCPTIDDHLELSQIPVSVDTYEINELFGI